MHSDHHGVWIDPKDPNKLYNVNDGGFYRSHDGGKSWLFAITAGGAQIYNVTLDTSRPVSWAYGSIQDHGSRRGKVDTAKGRGSIPAVAWEGAPGGEGPAKGMGGGMEGMDKMMEGMGKAPPRELYPTLMSLPELTPEQREQVQSQADERMRSGVALLSEGLDRLGEATENED